MLDLYGMWSLSYVVKFISDGHGRYGSMEDCGQLTRLSIPVRVGLCGTMYAKWTLSKCTQD